MQSGSTILTFLFTDLEGSTRLWQQYPQEMKTSLARHDEIVRSAVERAQGWIVKSTGDGFHAAFSSPEQGLSACIYAQLSLVGEQWGETGPLHVRMGLNIGEAQPRGGDYYGTAVNRAARLMSAANGGQVLLSSAVVEMISAHLPEGASLRDLGEHRLKDLQRPEHIYQLVFPGLPDDFPAIASLNRMPNNLPSQPTIFVGRQDELGQIKEMLKADKVRLLTLVGPGGTGKTRLALQSGAELIDRFNDGTYFIDLAPLRDPNAVMIAIARAIGLKESSNGSMLEDLKGQLRGKSMLLLLDNFEQVTSAAVQVGDLIQYCPHLKLLVTSRESLRIRGEHLFPVPPLGLPEVDMRDAAPDTLAQFESLQLFIERAQAVRPGFQLSSDNAQAIAEICIRLDGLPLAIELAAARIRLFSPQALQKQLGDRLKMLRGGARDLPERQQTLRDTVDWSYELLDENEKKLFQLLSVFSGCTFEAVNAIASQSGLLPEGEIEVEEGLVSLVDKSLLRLLEEGTLEPRLKMLETIREYAAEQLRSNPALHDSVYHAHAVYFAEFAHQMWVSMTSFDREAAMQEMTAEVDNLMIAWRYWTEKKDLEQLQKMVNGLWLLNDGRGWYQATIELTKDLLDLLSTTPSSPEQAQQVIMLQTSLARALMAIKGYTSEVENAYLRALELSEGLGEVPQLFPVLRGLSSFYTYRAEFDKGKKIGERILELAERNDDDYLRVHGYLVLGANTGFLESFSKGVQILDKGISLFEREKGSIRPFQLGNNPGIVCYTTSAFFLYWLGFPDQAVERAERAIEQVMILKHPFTMAYALFHTGNLHMWLGNIALANERAMKMLEIAKQHGFQIWESLATMLLGATRVVLDHPEKGLSQIEQGFALYQGLKSPPVFFPQLISTRAIAFAQAGQPASGLSLLEDLLKDIDEQTLMRDLLPLLLLKGDLLTAVSHENNKEAASIFRMILAADPHMGGRILSLQAVTRLCKLEMIDGNAEQSARTLEEIYNSFTEGFETIDLRVAKSVLDDYKQTDR